MLYTEIGILYACLSCSNWLSLYRLKNVDGCKICATILNQVCRTKTETNAG